MPDSRLLPVHGRGRADRVGVRRCLALLVLAWSAGCAKRGEQPTERERADSSDASQASSPLATSQPTPAAVAETGHAVRQSAARPEASTPRVEVVAPVAAPSASASCTGASPPKAWLTSAGCVQVQRCPGVPGPCTKKCVPFPKQCNDCANCNCVGKALCGHGAAPICRGYEVTCVEP